MTGVLACGWWYGQFWLIAEDRSGREVMRWFSTELEALVWTTSK